eukprot:jgi/Ulvmu1/11974/UM082_0053.1
MSPHGIGIADASVHLHGICAVQARLASIVGSLFTIKDKCMDEINSPFGLDFDSTQQLVLASSELFRLSHQLHQCHAGLENVISNRCKGETKRNQYDQMKHAGQQWIIIAAKHRLRDMMKRQVRKRFHVAKYVGLVEQRSAGLTDRVRILEELLRETPVDIHPPSALARQATMPSWPPRLQQSDTEQRSRASAGGQAALRTGSPKTITPLTAQAHTSVDSQLATNAQRSLSSSSRASGCEHDSAEVQKHGVLGMDFGHGGATVASDHTYRDPRSQQENRQAAAGSGAVAEHQVEPQLGASELLELLEGCESEVSDVSVDSFGEARDPERAASQHRLLQARTVVEERLCSGAEAASGVASGVASTGALQPGGARQKLQALGLAGFALEAPEAGAGAGGGCGMSVQQAASILLCHQKTRHAGGADVP